MNKNVFVKLTIILCSYLFIGVCFANPPHTLWRADTRAPDIIFKEGFSGYGSNNNIIQHILGDSCIDQNSAFISTSANQNFVTNWVLGILNRSVLTEISYYIYEIRATDNIYSAATTLNHLVESTHLTNTSKVAIALKMVREEFEYDAVSRIEPEQIRGVTIISQDCSGHIVINHQENLDYQPGNTTANALPYTGSDHLPLQMLSTPMITGVPPEPACFLSPDELATHPPFESFLLYMINNVLD